MGVQLTLDQARSVFERLAQLKDEKNKNAKLCFSSTEVCLESDSNWRTAASYLKVMFPNYTYSRDLGSLYPLVAKAAQSFLDSEKAAEYSLNDFMVEKWLIRPRRSVQEVKAAKEGLEALKKNQYFNINDANCIQRSIDILASTESDIKNPIRKCVAPAILNDDTQDIVIDLTEEIKRVKEKNEQLKDCLYDEK